MNIENNPKIVLGKNDNHNSELKLIKIFDLEDEAWKPYDEADEFLDFINPPNQAMYNLENTQVNYRTLPFYKNVQLIRVSNLYPSNLPEDNFNFFYLKKDDHLVSLDGNTNYIQEINKTGVLSLTKETIFNYLKFYCTFCAASDTGEVFYIVEGPESEFLNDSSKHEKTRILRDYKGPRKMAATDNKSFMIETRVIHCGQLYDVKYKITADGSVIMTDDKHVGSI